MPRDSEKIQVAGIHLWLVLWKTYAAVRDYAAKDIASLGLSLTDFGILEALLHKGPLPVNDIGRKVALTSGSITIAVDRLENRGLVRRHTGTDDRRARVVHLTPAGRKLIERAFAAHSESMNRLGEVLSARERGSALRLLKKLGRAAE
jgi:MarR family transcriptional regulator, 2-MHQ and catechol-resistance regulon repressor